MKKRLVIKSELSEIRRLGQFVEECSREFGIPPGLVMSLNLALEEAVANIIQYAFPKSSEEDISIDAEKEGDSLLFTIIDHGMEFDPTQREEVDTTLSAEERPIGGLGILLISKIMDEVSYQRVDGENRLILRKKINN